MNWLRWLPFVKAAEWRGFEEGRRFAKELYKSDAQEFYNEAKRLRGIIKRARSQLRFANTDSERIVREILSESDSADSEPHTQRTNSE